MRRALGALAAPALRALDPETAHRAAVTLMRWAPVQPAPDDPTLAVEALGLHFANPIGLAAGFDKDGIANAAAFRLGFGFTEIGTLTPRPQKGNPRPRVFRLPADGAVINRYGFNNGGMAAAGQRLARRTRGGVIGINIGANKSSTDRVADYLAGLNHLIGAADYFVLNVSSPNTPGLRDLQDAGALDDLLARTLACRDGLVARHGRKPILLKIAPDLDLFALDVIVTTARRRQVDGLIVSNTTTARPTDLLDRTATRETGGLSGRPLFARSTRLLAATYRRTEGQFPLIGVGGVDSGARALDKIRAGATLLQLYTGLVYRGVGLINEIKQHLRAVTRTTPLHKQIGCDAAAWEATELVRPHASC